LKRNVEIIERRVDHSQPEEKKIKKTEYSKEFYERQEILKKQYGSNISKNSSTAKPKSSDDHETEIMRLG
jgi:hypothetical protein